ncbi:hypothetical protein QX776_06150 [Alteromonadaceae bacterium BrNp21-10]|nr:hypothetical protein [Alteromonadaceae bacterium BrNp21-10]
MDKPLADNNLQQWIAALAQSSVAELQQKSLSGRRDVQTEKNHCRFDLIEFDKQLLSAVTLPTTQITTDDLDTALLAFFEDYLDAIFAHIDHIPEQQASQSALHIQQALNLFVTSYIGVPNNQRDLIKNHLALGAATARKFLRAGLALCFAQTSNIQQAVNLLDASYFSFLYPFMSIKQTTLVLLSMCLIDDEQQGIPKLLPKAVKFDTDNQLLGYDYAVIEQHIVSYLHSLPIPMLKQIKQHLAAGEEVGVFGCPAIQGNLVRKLLTQFNQAISGSTGASKHEH